MPVQLYRIDDRLIHGQVVVGWGQPLNIRLIVLVDDDVACCDWEQDLYRMGVPPDMELRFTDVAILELPATYSTKVAGLLLRFRKLLLLFQATEPILGPVRRLLPQTGAVDWSGFVVLILLGFLWRAF